MSQVVAVGKEISPLLAEKMSKKSIGIFLLEKAMPPGY